MGRARARNEYGATVVLAGLPGVIAKRPLGWRFLTHLYGVPGFRRHFDVAAFQPYSHDGTELKYQMNKFRTVMKRHGDKLKQLWVTEFGFGSAPHTGDFVNYGLAGQAKKLRTTYKIFLNNHKLWKLRGIIWYDWRDPASINKDCSFCSTAGLLKNDFEAKPAFGAFKHFTGAGP